MLNESSAASSDSDAAATPIEPATDGPPTSPLTLLGLAHDDDLICVDEICAPGESTR